MAVHLNKKKGRQLIGVRSLEVDGVKSYENEKQETCYQTKQNELDMR